jgi:PAS domain S-box-containing protein
MKVEGRISQALRVLLIEENPHDARFFKELCQDLRLPLRLHHEGDTARGLERLLNEPYDLLVLSAYLEGSYNLQLLRQVHLALPLLPVVLLLDGDDTHLATKALYLGGEAWLSKVELDEHKVTATFNEAVLRGRIKASFFWRDSGLGASNAWVLSPTGQALTMTGSEHIYGIASETFIAQPNLWENFVHPDDKPLLENYWQVINERSEHTLRYRILHYDGGTRLLEDKARVIKDKQGKPLRFEGVVRDVTAHEENIF